MSNWRPPGPNWRETAAGWARDVTLRVGGDAAAAIVEWPSVYPEALPEVRLVEPPRHATAHVSWRGHICLAHRDHVLLDTSRPQDVLDELVARAEAILEVPRSEQERDLYDEYTSFWVDIVEHVITTTFEPDGKVQSISYDPRRALPDGMPSTLDRYDRHPSGHARGLYVPLNWEARPPLPSMGSSAWELCQRLYEAADNDVRAQVERKLEGRDVLVFGVSRPSGDRTMVGMRITRKGPRHPLHGGRLRSATPFACRRVDRAFVAPRGGALPLQGRRVVVAGCGAVGAHVVLELVRAGVGHLSLIDPDTMTPANTFRHALGLHLDYPDKVTALREYIQGRWPYVQVDTRALSVGLALRQDPAVFDDADLIVLTTGSARSELAFAADLRRQRPGGATLIHGWVEPLGLGGAALRVTTDQPGCLHCLHCDEYGGFTECKVAMIASGQAVEADLDGCGDRFVPFGSLDALKTAVCVTDMALETLLGRDHSSEIRSWRGARDQADARGVQVSRYFSDGAAVVAASRFCHPACPTCGP